MSPRLFLLLLSSPLGLVLVFFLRFLHVSEVSSLKKTIRDRVPPCTLSVLIKRAIPAYLERVLTGFPASFQPIGNVQGLRGRFVKTRAS